MERLDCTDGEGERKRQCPDTSRRGKKEKAASLQKDQHHEQMDDNGGSRTPCNPVRVLRRAAMANGSMAAKPLFFPLPRTRTTYGSRESGRRRCWL